MLNKLYAFLICLLATLALSSCSTMAPTTPPLKTTWAKREINVSELQKWQLNGKLGVQTAKDSGSATINWQQNGQAYTIALFGPLGTNSLKLQGHPGLVTMTTSEGKSASAPNPESLLQQQWGWNLPVSNLKYWVRGLPVPGQASNTTFDSYHRLSTLTQGEWRVQYLGYTNVNGVELPNRIAINSSLIKAKLIVYGWKIS